MSGRTWCCSAGCTGCRDLGGVTFIDIRDRAGVSQVVVRENDALMADRQEACAPEFVVGVSGVVQRRSSDDTVNPEAGDRRSRGARARDPRPERSEDAAVPDRRRRPGLRKTSGSRYRYLDLRRPRLQHNIGLRHRVVDGDPQVLRRPRLLGDRDADSGEVDARRARATSWCRAACTPGEFYALPQSPQIFKQILMIAGHRSLLPDRRAASATRISAPTASSSSRRSTSRCRSRGRRRSTASIEPLMPHDLQGDRPRGDAADPPDAVRRGDRALRIRTSRTCAAGWRSTICRTCFRESEFRVFKQIVADGGVVRGFAVPGGNSYSRSQLDVLVDQAKQMGFTGLIWVRPGEPPLELGQGARARRRCARRSSAPSASADDLLLMAAGTAGRHVEAARPAAAGDREEGEPARTRSAFEFLWVTDFPLLEYNAEDGRWYSMHHPFTAPHDEDVDKLESDPGAVRAKAYDLVLNGIGDRRRQRPDPRRGAAGADLPAPRHHRRGGEAAASVSSSRRSNTARRRTAASRSGSTGSSRSWPASRRFAR